MKTLVRGTLVVKDNPCRMQKVAKINLACAEVLREFRKESGLSQERLALDAELDRTYISLLERGLRQPSIKTLFAIAAILKVPPHTIVQSIENKMNSAKF